METLKEIHEMWEADANIPSLPDNIKSALLNNSKLHQKYLRILSHYRREKNRLQIEYNNLSEDKRAYYNHTLDDEIREEYGWPIRQQIAIGLNTSTMERMLNNDKDLNQIKNRLDYCQEVVDVCKSIIDDLGKQGFRLKTHVDYEKFLAAVF